MKELYSPILNNISVYTSSLRCRSASDATSCLSPLPLSSGWLKLAAWYWGLVYRHIRYVHDIKKWKCFGNDSLTWQFEKNSIFCSFEQHICPTFALRCCCASLVVTSRLSPAPLFGGWLTVVADHNFGGWLTLVAVELFWLIITLVAGYFGG